jgi:ATP-binding cassette subfamily B protein
MGERLERDMREELYISLLGKSMTFHDMRPVGDTMARATNDVKEINLMANPGLNLVIGSANFMIMPFILAPSYHWQLLLAPTFYIVLYILALVRYLRVLNPVADRVRLAFGQMNSRLAEAIDGIEMVKGTAQEDQEIMLFDENAGDYRDGAVAQGRIEARFLPLLLLGLAQAIGFTHALYLFRLGEIAVGDVIAYMGLLTLFQFPTFISLMAYSRVALGLAGARRILELIKTETELDENVAGYQATIQGAIRFDSVTFGYAEGTNVLQEVSFAVEPGQTVAIVGQTGSGKSSVAKLINRTYDVGNGRILIDNVDVRDWNLAALRQQISIIEQDIFLFSRTVAENIAFGHPDASQEMIENAAKMAQAHDFILGFKDGYQTVIGQRGVTLSGGQRQRLALARAFLTNPCILILDDSTSAVDSATEDQIQSAIERASANQTTILITHRLSQIRWADLVVVLRKGRIEASGNHEQLMASSPAYRRIFEQYEEAT